MKQFGTKKEASGESDRKEHPKIVCVCIYIYMYKDAIAQIYLVHSIIYIYTLSLLSEGSKIMGISDLSLKLATAQHAHPRCIDSACNSAHISLSNNTQQTFWNQTTMCHDVSPRVARFRRHASSNRFWWRKKSNHWTFLPCQILRSSHVQKSPPYFPLNPGCLIRIRIIGLL